MLVEYGTAAREEWKDGLKENYYGRLLVPTDSLPHLTTVETDYRLPESMTQIKSHELTFRVSGTVEYSDV
jgi:hypothetical protein